jgi:nucleoside-diphosphate-sugar epimerase
VEFPKSEFLVWGSGRQRRAFVFVSDVVDAILRSLDYGFGKGVIQIGPSESISIAEVAQKIKKISGKPINIKFDLSKNEGDVDRKADSSKAKRILGWEPQVSFDEGLEKTYQWVANEVGRYSNG